MIRARASCRIRLHLLARLVQPVDVCIVTSGYSNCIVSRRLYSRRGSAVV